MAAEKRHYYKQTNETGGFNLLNLKSELLSPLPEGCEEITVEEYYALVEAKRVKKLSKKGHFKEIAELKAKLRATDYKVNKRIEGYYTDEEWASICAERKAWRDRINELEGEHDNA